jgi:hypothetical protein
MALADLTKQLAQQALLSATKEPAPPAAPDQTGAVILGQIAAMQKALKEDEELVVLCHTGGEKIRVMEIFLPSPQVAVLTGLDSNRALTRVISAVEALQLVARTAKAPSDTKPVRVGLITAKPKDSSGK